MISYQVSLVIQLNVQPLNIQMLKHKILLQSSNNRLKQSNHQKKMSNNNILWMV